MIAKFVCLCFSSHKVYMKIQEVMMKQLGCLTWDQVIEEYPITSSYKALSEYFIAFKDWVSIACVEITEYILLHRLTNKYEPLFLLFYIETMS